MAEREPRWRVLNVERYLKKFSEALDPRAELKLIFKEEPDRLVKDYLKLLIRHARPIVLPSKHLATALRLKAVEDAHNWQQDTERAIEGAMVRAMAMADRTLKEIASELAMEPLIIDVFLKLFFDVLPLLQFDAILLKIVLGAEAKAVIDPRVSQEALWLRIAYRSGWEVLQAVMFGRPLADPTKIIERLDDQITGQLAIRARQFTEGRMNSSESGTAADFRAYLQHKRLVGKEKAAEDAGVAKRKAWGKNFNGMFMDKLQLYALKIFAIRLRNPSWQAAMAEEAAALDSRKERVAYYRSRARNEHVEDELLEAAEDDVYARESEARAKNRAEIEAEIMQNDPECQRFHVLFELSPKSELGQDRRRRAGHWQVRTDPTDPMDLP